LNSEVHKTKQKITNNDLKYIIPLVPPETTPYLKKKTIAQFTVFCVKNLE